MNDDDVLLPEYLIEDLMTLKQASKFWPKVFTLNELQCAVKAKRLGHIRKANKIYVSEAHLVLYLEQMEVSPCEPTADSSNSANTGSITTRRKNNLETFTGGGTTPTAAPIGGEALAQKILSKPNKP